MGSTRRVAVVAALVAAGLALAGCQQGGAGAGRGKNELATDMAIGEINAPVTVIEYASVTCSHCKDFHDNAYPTLKKDYIDTGKVRFVFRELPTPPIEIAAAGFQLARCGNAAPDAYFGRLDVLFEQQFPIFQASTTGQARPLLLQIAQSVGLSEQQFDACLKEEKGYQRIESTTKEANDRGIEGTPTLLINGQKVTNPVSFSPEWIRKQVDAKLGGS